MELVEAEARTIPQHHPRGIMREEEMTVMEALAITKVTEVVTIIMVAQVAAVTTDTAATLIETTAEVAAVVSW